MEYKAYSFDLDDNLLKMPTKILLENSDGIEKSYSTMEFEKIVTKLDELGLKITDNSFRGFMNEQQFFDDLELAEEAGSWKNLVNCIVKHASIFAIITARQQSAETLKRGMKKIILKKFTKEHLKKFKEKFAENNKKNYEDKTIEEVLDEYLDICKFYPVNNPLIIKEFGIGRNTSKIKALAFQHFRDYVYTYVKDNFDKDTKIKIGFSDDSINNLSSIVNEVLKQHGLFFYHTKENSKKIDFI